MSQNRLRHQKTSPYLLQHATNPVDWFAWGQEAFDLARTENKPIFLSIGYSTCHWCHVMAHESFESLEVANLLNESFISIKVDREERPDIDQFYLSFVQATIGHAGWPLSVWLSPDLKPFFGGTYFPTEDQGGRVGFKSLLTDIAQTWKNQPDAILKQSGDLFVGFKQLIDEKPSGDFFLHPALLAEAGEQIMQACDLTYGGFGSAPKFPQSSLLEALLVLSCLEEISGELSEGGKAHFVFSLSTIVNSGIYDQIGGGIHRYAVDEQWQVPHFEKMLCDQAQFIALLTEVTYLLEQESSDEKSSSLRKTFQQVGEQSIDYLWREMRHPLGAFYAAQDADSLPHQSANKKVEGAFYVWEKVEIELAISNDLDRRLFETTFGIEAGGNVLAQYDIHGELMSKNILHRSTSSLEELAEGFGLSITETHQRIERVKQALFKLRLKRPPTHRDDKILVAWNGLLIASLAKAYRAWGNSQFLQSAQEATHFIRTHLYDEATQSLNRCLCSPESHIAGFLEDYAFLISALIELYHTDGNWQWLQWAEKLQDTQETQFSEAGSGYFLSALDETLPLRFRHSHDTALPSTTAVSLSNLFFLHHYLKRDDFSARHSEVLVSIAFELQNKPLGNPANIKAYAQSLSPLKQVIIVGDPLSKSTQELKQAAWKTTNLACLFFFIDSANQHPDSLAKHPFLKTAVVVEGKPTAYLCENFSCQKPFHSPKGFTDD